MRKWTSHDRSRWDALAKAQQQPNLPFTPQCDELTTHNESLQGQLDVKRRQLKACSTQVRWQA